MIEIERLFWETRKDRLFHRSRGKGGQIDACCAAIREIALVDAMVILGLDKEKARKMLKIKNSSKGL